MIGYDISWAGFNIIEVMSSPKFTCKRIGYLAASQCFHADSELLMLTTNMIRKDLNAQHQFDAGVALSGLSCFISTDLSRDMANDIMTLMSSTKPYLRMKSVLMMYKVFLRYPEALRPAFPKLKEKLEDPDPGVQSAAVNVICELARKNPKNYLSLAPIFFKLMTTSTNNWMLIKIIKLVSLESERGSANRCFRHFNFETIRVENELFPNNLHPNWCLHFQVRAHDCYRTVAGSTIGTAVDCVDLQVGVSFWRRSPIHYFPCIASRKTAPVVSVE